MTLTPKPPPTSGATTCTCSRLRPNSRLSPARTPVGACVESYTSSAPCSSKRATIARPSSGIEALRSISSRQRKTWSAFASAASTSPCSSVTRPSTLSGRSECTSGASGAAARLEVGRHRQRLVLDADALRGILGHVAVAGDDHRDRLADVAHLVARERVLRAAGDDRLVRDDQRQRLGEAAVEVVERVDGVDALDVERARYVDVADARMRVLRAQEGGVSGVRREVVGVAAVAGQQPLVLPALDALAEAHAVSSSSAAAARTARTMPT